MPGRHAIRRDIALAVTFALSLAAFVVGYAGPGRAAFPDTSTPTLELDHTLRTSPFVGSDVSMHDDEGSAYVAGDDSLWLADDNNDMIYEVDPGTGELKRTIGKSVFANTPQYGGGPQAGIYRDRDFESMSYDAENDILYVFSGTCCTPETLPTVFRLTRDGSGDFQVDSYQPLPTDSDNTASDWNPDDGKIYVARGRDIKTYDYTRNSFGSPFQISSLSGIRGMTFSSDGADLYVVRKQTLLSRVDWAKKSLVSGWTFDLSSFGMLDTRGVALINDQFWVSDGYDFYASGDPLSHAVYAFNVPGSTTTITPTASFKATPTSGAAPLTVKFTSTSVGSPTSWSWNFDDGQTSSAQNPSHTFEDPGTYQVTLTVANSAGSDSDTATITAKVPVRAPTASFTETRTSGSAPLTVEFADTSTDAPTSWSWDFGDGHTSTTRNPSHTFDKPGTYRVVLTATNSAGSDDATTQISSQDTVAPEGEYTVSGGSEVWATYTKVSLSEVTLSDNFTADGDIRRVVNWNDGTAHVRWTSGTTLRHVYDTAGTYRPVVRLTDPSGNTTRVETGSVLVRSDSTPPRATLTRPEVDGASLASWRGLDGRTGDGTGSGVAKIRLRVVEKRGTAWYAYDGHTRSWVRAGSTRASATKLSRLAVFRPTTAHDWTYRLRGLRKGLLVTRVSARDRVGNVSTPIAYQQSLTRS